MRLKRLLLGLAVAGLSIFCEGICLAHGVGYRHADIKAISLEFFYSTGEAMSYREARVFSPSDAKFAVQTGRTDEKGRFAFMPDAPGEWHVIVRDEEGHQCDAALQITQAMLEGDITASPEKEEPEIWLRALLGVSLIFNIALLFRRRGNHAHQ